MRRIYILLFILLNISTNQYIFPQESDSITDEDNRNAIIEENNNDFRDSFDLEAWKADSKTILTIISKLREFKESSDDSTLQEQHKKQKLNEELIKINKAYLKKTLSLRAVRIEDVTPEKRISDYGIKKAKDVIRQLKKDPSSAVLVGDGDLSNNPLLAWTVGVQLAFCDKCFIQTGRYEVKCKIPTPDSNYYFSYKEETETDDTPSEDEYTKLPVIEIILIVKSKNNALKYSKDEIISITGKVQSIDYNGSSIFESIKIIIE